tara:strand:- start:158467 stop:158589 length:123 start_codon:yes stop_codon:yes gene_type:complete
LFKDRAEQHNVANKFHGKVNDLKTEWEAMAKKYNAYPAPN